MFLKSRLVAELFPVQAGRNGEQRAKLQITVIFYPLLTHPTNEDSVDHALFSDFGHPTHNTL